MEASDRGPGTVRASARAKIGRRAILGAGAAAATLMPSMGVAALAEKTEPASAASKRSVRTIIDVHSHPSMPLYHDLIHAYDKMGSDARFPDRIAFPPGLPVWNSDQAIETMERNAIAAQVLSLPDVTLGLRGETARRHARQINEALAEVVAEYPGRFAAFAVVPHDDMDSTLREIAYALDVLKLDGVCTSTNIRGTYIGDPIFDPWMAELHRRRAVLFIHPTMPSVMNPAVPPVIEFSFDSARMIMNMVLSGAKRRFSDIKVISTHGGGAMPSLAHRLAIVQPLVSKGAVTTQQIEEDLRSFYYDLTSCMGEVNLAAAMRLTGSRKLLMGFDYPYAPETMMREEIERFFAFDGMADADRSAITTGNALALFPRLATR